ncbi:hypothetical protein N2152v2_004492 [Parachlorella kessleri]
MSKGKDAEKTETISGVVFKPFEEVAPVLRSTTTQGELNAPEPEHSFVRMHFQTTSEAAVNEQINIELNISYVYLAMASYFDRDNVSLPGLAEHFRNESFNERHHAQKLIDFQNTRGGRVRLNAIVMPEMEYNHPDKGDALYAMELALSLEKLNFEKLRSLWAVAERNDDPQMTNFVEDMLSEQAEDIKEVGDYVAQLRRIGKGHGVWHFDHELYEEEVRSRSTANSA